MFDSIKAYFRDVRITLDFKRLERRFQTECLEIADQRYNTTRLCERAAELRLKAAHIGDREFGFALRSVTQRISAKRSKVEQTEEQLKLFDRDYKGELDVLYAKKDAAIAAKRRKHFDVNFVKARLNTARAELDDVRRDLEKTKASISRWHDKAESLRSSGDQVPRFSLFGISRGDLIELKRVRDNESDSVDSLKKKIGALKSKRDGLWEDIEALGSEVGRLDNEIASVKVSRQRIFDLREQGTRRGDIQRKLDYEAAHLLDLEQDAQNLKTRRDCLIAAETERLGVPEIEASIAEIEAKKAKFIKSITSDESRDRRRVQHRAQWLIDRGHASE